MRCRTGNRKIHVQMQEMVVQKMVVQAQGFVSEKVIWNDLDYITQV